MRKIKLLSVLVVFCTAVFVVNFSSASAAKAVDPKETVIKAFRNTEKLENCHVNFDFAVSFPQGIKGLFSQGNNLDISVKGEYDVQVKPMLAKMNMNFSMKDGMRKFEQEVPFYAEEAGNEILFYCNNNNQWIKQSFGYEILDNAAIASVTKWRFFPAQMNGKAVAGNISVPIDFRLGIPGLLNPGEILNIQRKLNELGFDCGEPDGVIGPKTEQSIKDFQQSRGLTPNGIVGYETKKALGI